MMKTREQAETTMGFKDKQKALDTLTALNGRDVSFQFHVVKNFVNRAKRTLQITRDEEKLANLRDALKIFEDWLTDYKENNRGKENLAYLSLETIRAFRGLAKKYDVWDDEFFREYKLEKGDYKGLRAVKTPSCDTTWDIERNKRLKEIIGRIKDKNIQWYETDVGDFRGLPTKEHTRCIVLAYSPDPAKLKKLAAQAREAFDDDSEDEMEVQKEKEAAELKTNRGTKRAACSSSSSDDSSDESSNDGEPKTKSAKRAEPEAEQNESGTKNALSFKDKDRALHSIKSLEGRDVSYQFHAISGLVKRAERVISCTKDERKIQNMKEAVGVFENWITDYNVNGRAKENFDYLAIDIVRAFKPLAERYGIEDNGFLRSYEEADGDYKKLRSVRVPKSEITWDVRRNEVLREFVDRIKDDHVQWFHTADSELQGLPTAEHTRCIMWGFSCDTAKLKKLLPILNTKLKPTDD